MNRQSNLGGGVVERTQTLKMKDLGSNSDSAIYWLCDLGDK